VEVVLVRHGETEWSRDLRHTGRTDVPLTEAGEQQARTVGEALRVREFSLVLSSPLRRALDTARVAGFEPERWDDLAEWDYGEYEGMTTAEIREQAPGWAVWTHPAPGGETADHIAARADRVIQRLIAEATDRALVFSHAHFLRVLAARWIGQPSGFGRHLLLDTATISVLSWQREDRAIGRWNIGTSKPSQWG
jgi:broad specificity phosphatase PhoE